MPPKPASPPFPWTKLGFALVVLFYAISIAKML